MRNAWLSYSIPVMYFVTITCGREKSQAGNTIKLLRDQKKTISTPAPEKSVAPSSDDVTVNKTLSVSLSEGPQNPSADASLNAIVGGEGVAEYQFALNAGESCEGVEFSNFHPVSQRLVALIGVDGPKILCIKGRDSSKQKVTSVFSYKWVKDTVSPIAAMANVPFNPSKESSVNVLVAGEKVTHYQFALIENDKCAEASYSAFVPVATRIVQTLSKDGTFTLCVKGKDALGNTQSIASTYTWVRDTVAPIAALSDRPSNPSNSTSLNVLVGGDAIAQYQWSLRDALNCDGAVYSAFVSVGTRITSPMGADGNKTLCVKGKDGAGNIQQNPTSHSWVQDTMSPMASLLEIPAKASKALKLNVLVGGEGVVQYQYDLLNSNNCAGAIYSDFLPVSVRITEDILDDGAKVLCVKAKDRAGNAQQTPTLYSWIKDTLHPTAQLTDTPSNPSNQRNLNVKVGGEGVASYKFSLQTSLPCLQTFRDTNAINVNQRIMVSDLGSDGNKVLCVVGIDQAGNEQPTTTFYEWTFDSIRPQATLDNLPLNPSSNARLNVGVSPTEGTTYQYAFRNASSCQGATFSAFFPPSQRITDEIKGDGPKILCVKMKDNAGNLQEQPTQHSWVQDTTAPEVRIDGVFPFNPSNDKALNLTVSGTGVTKYKFALLNGNSCDSATYSADLPVSQKITSEIGIDGVKVLCVKGIDAASNIQPSPFKYVWTKDTVSPLAAFDKPPSNGSTTSQIVVQVVKGGTENPSSYQFSFSNGTNCASAVYSEFKPLSEPIRVFAGASGDKVLCAKAKDAAGNIQVTPTVHTWKYVEIPPVAILTTTVPNRTATNATSIEIKVGGTDIKHYSFITSLVGCSPPPGTILNYSPFFPVSESIQIDSTSTNHTMVKVCVKGKSAAGTIQASASVFEYVFDNKPPTGSLVNVTVTGTNVNAMVTVTDDNYLVPPSTFTAPKDLISGCGYKFRFASVAGTSCAGANYGSFFPTSSPLSVPNTAGRLCVQAQDCAGNISAPFGIALPKP